MKFAKVLIILEDPTNDKYIVLPIVEHIFKELKILPKFNFYDSPSHGFNQVTRKENLEKILRLNSTHNLFLLIVDRDCNGDHGPGRKSGTKNENIVRGLLTQFPDSLRVCLAVEEIEVWMLALHQSDPYFKKQGVSFQTIRKACDPKEDYAEPFLKAKGWEGGISGGRQEAMEGFVKSKLKSLLKVCPELQEFYDSLQTHLAQSGV